jgi:hypothetical protein
VLTQHLKCTCYRDGQVQEAAALSVVLCLHCYPTSLHIVRNCSKRLTARRLLQVYDGAVYMFQGRPFLCRRVDTATRVAEVAPADVRYYTTTVDFQDIHVIGGNVAYTQPLLQQYPATSACCNEAVVRASHGFKR